MRVSRRCAGLVVGVLVGVAGCSTSSGGAPAAGSSPSVSAPPADGGTYASTDALQAALTAHGLACGDPQPVANSTAPGAIGMVDCDSPGGGGQSDTVLVVFDTGAHAQAYAVSMAGAGLGPAQVVYGRDWAVNTVPPFGEQVRGALGGGMLTGAASPS